MNKFNVLLAILTVMALLLCACQSATGTPPASGITVKNLSAAEIDKIIKSNQGKVLVLDFWATWCPPCRKEIPGFIEIAKTYAKDKVAVIGLAADQGGSATVQPFVNKNNINYPVYCIDEDGLKKFGIEAFPTTFIYNRSGKLYFQHVGFTSLQQFKQDIEAALKAK